MVDPGAHVTQLIALELLHLVNERLELHALVELRLHEVSHVLLLKGKLVTENAILGQKVADLALQSLDLLFPELEEPLILFVNFLFAILVLFGYLIEVLGIIQMLSQILAYFLSIS